MSNMKFEIQGNDVSFRTNYPTYWKPTEEFLKKWLPVDVFGKTFYVERSDRLERIIIRKEDTEKSQEPTDEEVAKYFGGESTPAGAGF